MTFSPARAILNITLFLIWVGVLLIPYIVLLGFAPEKRHGIGQLFFKGCLRLTGLKLNISGFCRNSASLFVANHASYLDIIILGACIRKGVFVAKTEVASWPLFGFLARLSRTVFISRDPKDARYQRRLLAGHMNQGSSLIVFPEGTSSDGSHVKHFKSALFGALDMVNGKAKVQPVSLTYTRHKNGTPLTQGEREKFTWFGDMTLAPHLWHLFGTQGCEVDVVFHAPFIAAECFDRKQLARACENVISDHVAESLSSLKIHDAALTDDETVPLFIGAE